MPHTAHSRGRCLCWARGGFFERHGLHGEARGAGMLSGGEFIAFLQKFHKLAGQKASLKKPIHLPSTCTRACKPFGQQVPCRSPHEHTCARSRSGTHAHARSRTHMRVHARSRTHMRVHAHARARALSTNLPTICCSRPSRRCVRLPDASNPIFIQELTRSKST
jgi:hypothetical protein